jgi:hypothetical protein
VGNTWADENDKTVLEINTGNGNDKTVLEINTGNGKPNAFVLYNRKKSFNDGTREKGGD